MNAPNSQDHDWGEQQSGAGLIPLAALPLRLRLLTEFVETLRSNGLLSESDARRVLARLGIGRV